MADIITRCKNQIDTIEKQILLLPLMKAFVDGQTIQWKNHRGEWEDADNPGFFINQEYRIKPKLWYVIELKKSIPYPLLIDDRYLESYKNRHDFVRIITTFEF